MKIYAVIVAGGSGSRMGAGMNKALLTLGGVPVLRRTVDVFSECDKIDEIVIVARDEDKPEFEKVLCGCKKPILYARGGDTRQQSVSSGLSMCTDGDFVLIHDAARALIQKETLEKVIDDCIKYGAAAVGVKCKDTLKREENGFIGETLDREHTYNIQTPQSFSLDIIKTAHERAKAEGFEATDDCALVEHYGGKIKLTQGSYDNIKLTTPDDMAVGEMILKKRGGM